MTAIEASLVKMASKKSMDADVLYFFKKDVSRFSTMKKLRFSTELMGPHMQIIESNKATVATSGTQRMVLL